MRIVTVRRISQSFFLILFLWFCVVSTFGEKWWQLRGWPVNWFLQLDPLVAIGTLLATGTIYAGLAWALATIVLTILLGRFFCGWVCPFGSIHHFVGYLARSGKPLAGKVTANKYRPSQGVKYYLLLLMLAAAGGVLIARAMQVASSTPTGLTLLAAVPLVIAAVVLLKTGRKRLRLAAISISLLAFWTISALFLAVDRLLGGSLQTSLLDPIPLVQRSVNLIFLPLSDAAAHQVFVDQRYYQGMVIAAVILTAVMANIWIPRFYCRFICPPGLFTGFSGVLRCGAWEKAEQSAAIVNCVRSTAKGPVNRAATSASMNVCCA